MPRIKRLSLSIFFPCYNDSKTIQKLVYTANQIAKKNTKDYEIIVIDDGSTDNSPEILRKLQGRYKKLKLVFHKKNKGYGGTLKSGFKNTSKEVVFYTDGDGQYDVNELPILLDLLSPDVDFVNGIKMSRKDAPHRIFFGNLHKFMMRWFFWVPVYDVDCDFRLIRKKILDKIKLQSNTGAICVELVKKAENAGAVFREVEVHHYERKWGNSQFFHPVKIISTYLDLGMLWLRLFVFNK